MREIISIHVGQAGIQVGNACWELFCLEHGIQPDGQLPSDKNASPDDNSFHSFFSETEAGKYIPRSIFVDLEPTVIDEVKTSAYRDLFSADQMLYGKEGSGNICYRAGYSANRDIANSCLDKFRKLADNCTNLQGIMIYNAIGGGTGSGLGSFLAEKLSIDYGKKIKVGLNIFPSPQVSSIIVEPYNAVYAMSRLIDYLDISFVFDNEAIYDICKYQLGIESPNYTNLNGLIAQVITSSTASLRSDEALNFDLTELQTNLVPYPRIHFMLSSYSPIISAEKSYHEEPTVVEMTKLAFEANTLMAKVNPKLGKYMALCLMYRGENFIPKSVGPAIISMKANREMRFVDWSPTGFKCGIMLKKPLVLPGGDLANTTKAVSMIANSTSVVGVFSKLLKSFNTLYERRAFRHWYFWEGPSEDDFKEARENLASLKADYEEVYEDNSEEEGERDD